MNLSKKGGKKGKGKGKDKGGKDGKKSEKGQGKGSAGSGGARYMARRPEDEDLPTDYEDGAGRRRQIPTDDQTRLEEIFGTNWW